MSDYSRRKKTLKERIRVSRKTAVMPGARCSPHKLSDISAVMRSNFVNAGCPNPPKRKSVRRQRCLTLPAISAGALARIKPSNSKASHDRTGMVRDYPSKPVKVEE